MATPAKPKRSIDLLFPVIIALTVVLLVLIIMLGTERGSYLAAREQSQLAAEIKNQQAAFSKETAGKINSAFVDEEQVVAFIQELERAGQTFTTFKLDFETDAPEGKTDKYLTFTLDFSGSYKLVDDFIHRLLNAEWIIDVQNVELTSEDGFTGVAQCVLTARIYVSDKFNK